MDLNDKAEDGGEVLSIEDAADSAGTLRVESTELEPAEDVGTDKYPQYGDWMPVTRVIDGIEHGDSYVETPQGLAKRLVDHGVEEGTEFVVTAVQKTRDGIWDVTVEFVGDD